MDAWVRLRLELLTRFGFPDLWLRWPVGVARFLRACLSPWYVLSSFEFWTRPYYERIAHDFDRIGRFGYVWDEALGIPLGPRIYNNWATYALFGVLSPRLFRLLALVAYLGAIVVAGEMTGNRLLAWLIALLLLGSPAGLHSLFAYMLKPEVVWWPLALIAVTAALAGHWPMTLVAGGVLLLANASVAAIAGFLVAPLWLFDAWRDAALPGGLALGWLAPGILKTVLRILQARADGLGGSVAAEQKKVARARSVTRRELASLALWFGVPLLLAGWPAGPGLWLVGPAAVLFWLANDHLVKLADTVTMLLALLTVLVALALVGGNWMGLLGIAWFAFYQPFRAFPAMAGKAQADGYGRGMASPPRERLHYLAKTAKDFPWFQPSAMPQPASVVRLLDAIPDGSRVLLESDADARVESAYRYFRNWADAVVAPRQVELVNQFFLVRVAEPALADLYLDRFTTKILASPQMLEVCRRLGASHVVAFSGETAAGLEAVGFRRVAEAAESAIRDFADGMHMPATGVVLLAAPGAPAVMEPAVPLRRRGNVVSWQARAGQEYVLRYRYHRNFVARQGGTNVAVLPEAAFTDLPLRFMRVTAVADGPLAVEFQRRWRFW